MHVIAGKAVCLREAAQPAFKVYAENVVKNAKALAAALLERGFDLVTGGTDNHLMLADLRKKNITGKDLQIKLDEVHITVNKNAIPNDPQKPGVTNGVRIGTRPAPRAALPRKTCPSSPTASTRSRPTTTQTAKPCSPPWQRSSKSTRSTNKHHNKNHAARF